MKNAKDIMRALERREKEGKGEGDVLHARISCIVMCGSSMFVQYSQVNWLLGASSQRSAIVDPSKLSK